MVNEFGVILGGQYCITTVLTTIHPCLPRPAVTAVKGGTTIDV